MNNPIPFSSRQTSPGGRYKLCLVLDYCHQPSYPCLSPLFLFIRLFLFYLFIYLALFVLILIRSSRSSAVAWLPKWRERNVVGKKFD